jgi:hypothetical protein
MCSQRFVSVFTETVDWADSEDPQYWAVLPLTRAEATDLTQRIGSLFERDLAELGPDRRCLRRDHPKGEEPSHRWSAGMRVGSHD